MTTNLPRDVFLYLLAIITLIAVAIAFGIVVFQMINVNIPDIVTDAYMSRSSYLSTMRSALAAVVIVFPVFLWVSWFLRKDIAKFPEKKELKIRKWLLYLTLFIAALVIIGDLVTLVRSFLEGELSQRFILKVVAILFIAGSIFVHYLSELKEKSYNFIKIFDWMIIAVVGVSIIFGFVMAGSPQNQRLVRLDEQRTGDLQSIQWQIINYWQRKESLPVKLDDMADPISGSIIPRDPETGASYEYSVLNKLSFELCAVFSTVAEENTDGLNRKTVPMPVAVGPDGMAYPEMQNVWWHEQGRTCFERTIDPDLYPPINDNIKPRPL